MNAIRFDTLVFVKRLESHGFSHDQAEGINEALKDVLNATEVATKQDIENLRKEIEVLGYKLTIRMSGIMAAAAAVIAAIQKLL